MDTSKSGSNHAVLHAKNDRLCRGPRETSIYGANHADLHAQMTGEVWVPNRFVILLQKSLFCMQKPQKRAGTHKDK